MPGSHTPRPAKGNAFRSGRPPTEPEAPPDWELLPDESAFFVEGRAEVYEWTGPKRVMFTRLCSAAEFFGLVVREGGVDTKSPRRSWTRNRVSFDYALATVADVPGIRFDEWVKLWIPPRFSKPVEGQGPVPPQVVSGARAKAAVALSKLYNQGLIVKRYDDEGNMLLYTPKNLPKKESV